MDKKEVLEKVIEVFKLRKDFFERNPVTVTCVNGKYVDIAFERSELILTRDEYERIGDRLFWGCAACCGVGSQEVQEGEYVRLIGYGCMCHPTHWWWSLCVQL